MYAAVLADPRTPCAPLAPPRSGASRTGPSPSSLMLAVTAATAFYAVAGAVMALTAPPACSCHRCAPCSSTATRRARAAPDGLSYARRSRSSPRSPGALGALGYARGASPCRPGRSPRCSGPRCAPVWGRLLSDRRPLQGSTASTGSPRNRSWCGPLLVGVLVLWAPAAFGVALRGSWPSARWRSSRRPRWRGWRRCRGPGGGGVRGRSRDLRQPVVVTRVRDRAGARPICLSSSRSRRGSAALGGGILAALSAGSAVGGLLSGAPSTGAARAQCPAAVSWPRVWRRARRRGARAPAARALALAAACVGHLRRRAGPDHGVPDRGRSRWDGGFPQCRLHGPTRPRTRAVRRGHGRVRLVGFHVPGYPLCFRGGGPGRWRRHCSKGGEDHRRQPAQGPADQAARHFKPLRRLRSGVGGGAPRPHPHFEPPAIEERGRASRDRTPVRAPPSVVVRSPGPRTTTGPRSPHPTGGPLPVALRPVRRGRPRPPRPGPPSVVVRVHGGHRALGGAAGGRSAADVDAF